MSALLSGSYESSDVTFLLKHIEMPATDIIEKEQLIQAGKRHYSEMISREMPPSCEYLTHFSYACKNNGARFCADLLRLAKHLWNMHGDKITIVSLARAGTPIGVLLKRIFDTYYTVDVRHYSISIIRDIGIDSNALKYILDNDARDEKSIVFVDGWTGKGVIARELEKWIDKFNKDEGCNISSALNVVADISGTAAYSATFDDYLIPSAILNSIISGLVSRSILNHEYIGKDDFHGCIYYKEYEQIDLSRKFIDSMMISINEIFSSILAETLNTGTCQKTKNQLRANSKKFITTACSLYGITDENFIKPGIGEATRVLLRRVPQLLLLKDAGMQEVAHLRQLAQEKCVNVEINSSLPYNAAALIATVN